MKKITSMFLALVMALALAIPAYAEETLQVEGTIQLPTVNVVLPTAASMILNPYELEVKLNKNDATGVTDQIISPVMMVKNLSNIGIQVGVTAQGTLGRGEATFKSTTAAASTNKEVFVYAMFQIGDDTMTDADFTAPTTPADGDRIVVLSDTAKPVTKLAPTDTAVKSGGDLNVLAATSGKTPAANGVLGFKFFGDASKTAAWTDKDTVGATLVFTFTQIAGERPLPSAGDAAVTVNISGTTATANFNAGTSGLTATSYAWTSGTTATATVSGTTNTATITQAGGASAGDTSVITVTVTLSNGATITGNATFTAS